MASPTFGDIGTLSTGAGDRTPGVPANTVIGSFILMVEGISSSGTRTGITSGGDGTWANFVGSVHARGTYYVDWKVIGTAGSEGSTYAVPAHASLTGKTYALRLAGVDPTTPIHATTSFADGSTAATAAVSLSSLPECLLVWVWQAQGAGSTTTISALPTVGGTPMVQRSSGSQFYHVATLPFAGGNTGSVTGTTASGPLHRCMLLAVLPSGVAGPTEDVIIGGAKKTVTARSEMTGGAKKTVPTASVIIGGTKKTTVWETSWPSGPARSSPQPPTQPTATTSTSAQPANTGSSASTATSPTRAPLSSSAAPSRNSSTSSSRSVAKTAASKTPTPAATHPTTPR